MPGVYSLGELPLPSGLLLIQTHDRTATPDFSADAVRVHAITQDASEWIDPSDRTRQPVEGLWQLPVESRSDGIFGIQFAEQHCTLQAIVFDTGGAEVVEWRLHDELTVGSDLSSFSAGDAGGCSELERLEHDATLGESIKNQLRGCRGVMVIDHPDVSAPLLQVRLRPDPPGRQGDRNIGRARVWAGLNSERDTVAVALDLQPFDQSNDSDVAPWHRDVYGWGRFSDEVESARIDFAAPAPWTGQALAGANDETRLQSLGTVPLVGKLFAGEPSLGLRGGSVDHSFVPLGVEVVAGLYPISVVYDRESWPRPGMLLLEIGQGAPERWTVAPGLQDASNVVVADIGQMSMWCESTPESLYGVDAFRARAAWDGTGGGIVVSRTTYGDGQVGAYVGVDAAGVPVAIALDAAGVLVMPEEPEEIDRMTKRFSPREPI